MKEPLIQNRKEEDRRRRIVFFLFILLLSVILVPTIVVLSIGEVVVTTTTVVVTTTSPPPTTTPPPPTSSPFNLVRFHNYFQNFSYIDYISNGTNISFVLVTPTWNATKPCFITAPMYSYAYLSIDPETGDHYVTASCLNNMSVTKSFIYKYSPAGSLVWEREYDDFEFSTPYQGRFLFNGTIIYTMKQTVIGVEIWKLSTLNGDVIGTSGLISANCDTLPNYLVPLLVYNMEYAHDKLVVIEWLLFDTGETHTCVQTYDPNLVLQFIYRDQLTYQYHRPVCLDIDKITGDVLLLIYDSYEGAPGMSPCQSHLLKYDPNGNLIYAQSFFNQSYCFADMINPISPRPTTFVKPPNELYWIGDAAPSIIEEFVIIFNITNGNQTYHKSVPYSIMTGALYRTTPMLSGGSLYFGLTIDDGFQNFSPNVISQFIL